MLPRIRAGNGNAKSNDWADAIAFVLVAVEASEEPMPRQPSRRNAVSCFRFLP